MTDLDKLIEAVEAGTFPVGNPCFALIDLRDWMQAGQAFDGSLDAAKRLHDALLPGWDFDVTNGSAFVVNPAEWDWGWDAPMQFQADNDDPARAWLLAILRAVKAKG